jgi:hypothetical protein
LHLVPAQPTGVTARVVGGTAYLTLSVPTRNAANGGPLALDHLDVYAVTVDAGATPPSNQTLMTTEHAIAHIPIKPPVDPDEEAPEEPENDTRPGPGDAIGVAEPLSGAVLTPEITVTTPPAKEAAAPAATPPAAATPSPASANPVAGGQIVAPPTIPVPEATPPPTEPAEQEPEEPAAAAPTGAAAAPGAQTQTPIGAANPAPAAAAAAPAQPAVASVVTRIYVVRGMTRRNRPGTPSARAVVPLVPPPPPPTGVWLSYSESAVTISWLAPMLPAGSTPGFTYNVYAANGASPASPTAAGLAVPPHPLNPAPVAQPSLQHPGSDPGREQCFVVRTVQTISNVAIESEPSAPGCVTPVDRFAPAAPKSLAAVATTGAINLIWDANTEADLAGYVILRGEAPGDTLQPLMAEPIHDTRYRDTTTQAGVRYVYAVIAVDRAGNRSAASARVEETGR